MLYLGPPPRFLVDFTADEAALLRAIGSGAALYELVARFEIRGAVVDRALFSLLARSVVTMIRGQAVHPQAWKRILDQVEASLAVASLGTGPASLRAPPERPAATPVPRATPLPTATPVPAATPPPLRARSPEVHELFLRAGSELRGGNPAGAAALLRVALALAPGDAEIADAFAKLSSGRGAR
jgi:hypothetical protein